ncbi:hypothetical protein LCGC14_3081130 [marine sediment metagenome]|uniref:Uncharacterized protein n=1 Tax=marine sediment metagenome TaxID=412755 RepID=A0A0F8YKV1_9ZZZZ
MTETEINYYQNFTCPVCDKWIPCYNIAGNCPHCGSAGFKALTNKKKNNRGLKDMGRDFEIIINENTERGKDFIKVFGTSTINITSPIPKYILTPSKEKVLAYFLDLDLITKKQRETLINHISKKFNQSIDFVRENLDKMGVPILKKDCGLLIKSPQRWI